MREEEEVKAERKGGVLFLPAAPGQSSVGSIGDTSQVTMETSLQQQFPFFSFSTPPPPPPSHILLRLIMKRRPLFTVGYNLASYHCPQAPLPPPHVCTLAPAAN